MSTVAVPAALFAVVVVSGHLIRPRPLRIATISTRPHEPHRTTSRPRSTRHRVAVALFGALLIGLIAGPIAAAIPVAVTLVRPRLRNRQRQRRAAASVVAAFPDFVDLLVLSIRSGCTPVQAIRTLRESAPNAVRAAVYAVDRRVADGHRFADAVAALADRLGPVARPLADALALADRHGTPLAPILDRLADESRALRRRNAEVSSRQLPIRLSFPLVGCTLPSFVLLTIVPLMAGTVSSLPGLSS